MRSKIQATPVLSEYCTGTPSSSFPFDLRPHASLSEEMTVVVQGLSLTTSDISAHCSEPSTLIDLLILRFAYSMRRRFAWFKGHVSGLTSRHGDNIMCSLTAILITCGLFFLFTGSAYAQWVQPNGPYGANVNCFAVSGTHLFVGTWSGVFRSTNHGTSWTRVNSGLTHTYVLALAVSDTNIFAGTLGGGVFQSTNNGTSWTAINSGLTDSNVYSLAVERTSVFAGTWGGGVFHSYNNGKSWIAASSGLTDGYVHAFAVSGTTLFAGTWHGGVFRSTDRGTNWTAVNSGLSPSPIYALFVRDTNLYAGTYYGHGVFLSTNNGTNWTQAALSDADVSAIAGLGADLFVGAIRPDFSLWGVYRSTDGGTNWTIILDYLEVTAIAVSGTELFAGSNGRGVFRSTDGGTSWTPVNVGLTNPVDAVSIVGLGTDLFAGDPGGGVFISTDSGTSWNLTSSGLPSLGVWSLAVSGTNLFAGTDGGVFLSTDGGTSWTDAGLTGSRILALAVSGSNIVAGTNDWNVHVSTDNGASWSHSGVPFDFVTSIAISGTNLFTAGYGGGVFLSTNNGTSWTPVNAGLTNRYVKSLAVSGTNLFAGTYGGGVFLSSNGGTSWTAVSIGLTTVVSMLLPSQARISLQVLITAASFFPPTTAQVGFWLKQVSRIFMSGPWPSMGRISLQDLRMAGCGAGRCRKSHRWKRSQHNCRHSSVSARTFPIHSIQPRPSSSRFPTPGS